MVVFSQIVSLENETEEKRIALLNKIQSKVNLIIFLIFTNLI